MRLIEIHNLPMSSVKMVRESHLNSMRKMKYNSADFKAAQAVVDVCDAIIREKQDDGRLN